MIAGHSFGGPIIRLYASAHPVDVGGLVLVDALSEDLSNGLTPKQEALFEKINTPLGPAESLDESATFQQLRESPPAPPVPTIVLIVAVTVWNAPANSAIGYAILLAGLPVGLYWLRRRA